MLLSLLSILTFLIFSAKIVTFLEGSEIFKTAWEPCCVAQISWHQQIV